MSNGYIVRIRAIALATVFTGCSEPAAATPVDATLEADALVFEDTADENQDWSARLKVDDAPAGEYLLFASPERPTSLAGLAGLDLATCARSACNVPGLGRLGSRVKLDAPGTVELDAGSAYEEYPSSYFFVAVRRGSATNDRLRVKGTIVIAGNAGCGGSNPDPPSVKTSSLDGAPPIAEPVGGDAGAGPDAGTLTAPSCEVLQTQIDACTTISQPSKDTFPTFCSGISSSCRACLDGVLCGVTEQCDPVCGK